MKTTFTESELRDIISKTIAEALEETTEHSLNEDYYYQRHMNKVARQRRRAERLNARELDRWKRRNEREENDYSNQRKKEFYHLKMLIGDIMKYDETLLYYEPKLKSAIENIYQWCESHEEAYQNIIQWRRS